MSLNAPESCSLLGTVQEAAYEDCIPLNASLELTLRCNIRCTHCYNFDRDVARKAPSSPELSFAEIVGVLDEFRRAGTLYLSLTGGEAMVHPRFWDVLGEAAARRFVVSVLSNGTLLTEGACDRLSRYAALAGVSLSLYGAKPQTHDSVTRVRGSFEQTWSGARRMRERGAGVALKFVVMKANASEAAEMIQAAESEGFEYSVDTTITGRYDGSWGSLATRVDPATLESLYRGPLRGQLQVRKSDPSDDEWKCNCARGNVAVSSSGDVYPCIATPLLAGNVRERSFAEIWKHSEVFKWIRSLGLRDWKTCAPCTLKAWCRRSPGSAVLLHGDYTGVDPWDCKEAEIIRDVLMAPSPAAALPKPDPGERTGAGVQAALGALSRPAEDPPAA
jgi:radical SAM protein with 4Fe4S-binding SPASM domain